MDLARPHGLAVRTPAFHAGDRRFESGWGYSRAPWKSDGFAWRVRASSGVPVRVRGHFRPFRGRDRIGDRLHQTRRRVTASSPRISALSLVAIGSAHDLRVDRQGHGRISVSDLCLDVGKVVAGGDHVRDVGAPERVWCDVGADRRSDPVLLGSDSLETPPARSPGGGRCPCSGGCRCAWGRPARYRAPAVGARRSWSARRGSRGCMSTCRMPAGVFAAREGSTRRLRRAAPRAHAGDRAPPRIAGAIPARSSTRPSSRRRACRWTFLVDAASSVGLRRRRPSSASQSRV